MKEKRYFCDWWDKKKDKTKLYLIIASITACIVVFLMVVLGGFITLEYPEEMFKKLETEYIPYVHEGIGVDLVGMEKAVYNLRELIINDENMSFTYGDGKSSVTITLDEKYKVVSVKRNLETADSYARYVIVSNILSVFFSTAILCGSLAIIVMIIYLISYIHKFVDEKLSEKPKKKK